MTKSPSDESPLVGGSSLWMAWRSFHAEGAPRSFIIPGAPVPAPRPRVTRTGHVFYPKNYLEWMANAIRALSEASGARCIWPKGSIAVFVESITRRLAKSPPAGGLFGRGAESGAADRYNRGQDAFGWEASPPGDTDNLAKGPFDAATKAGLWGDDRQVVSLTSTKRAAVGPQELPRVVLWVAPARCLSLLPDELEFVPGQSWEPEARYPSAHRPMEMQ